MALNVTTRRDEEAAMGVTLKQRTYRTPDGHAVGEGDYAQAVLVGPEGAVIAESEAEALGLVDGKLPTKSRKREGDKQLHQQTGDKAPRRKRGGRK